MADDESPEQRAAPLDPIPPNQDPDEVHPIDKRRQEEEERRLRKRQLIRDDLSKLASGEKALSDFSSERLEELRGHDAKTFQELCGLGKWRTYNDQRRRDAQAEEAAALDKAMRAHDTRLRAALPIEPREPYVYTNLDNAASQVRLLEIGVIDGHLVGTQHAYELLTAPPFVAISYTWGSPQDTRIIFINGRSHQVRANCYHALQDYALKGSLDRIWVDSICINQQDNEEKAKQVQMMTSIFTQANWVAAVPQSPSSVTQLKTLREGTQSSYTSLDIYFTRLWIVQELLVAKHVTFIRNGASLDWDDLPRIRDVQSKQTISADMSRLSRLLHDRAKPFHASATAAICHYLSKYGDLSCHDPRDRLYALVPMALRSFDTPALRPNYDQSLFFVLSDFVRYICCLGGRNNSPLFDMLICLMKLVQVFALDLQTSDVQSFLCARLLDAALPITGPQVQPLGDESSPGYYVCEQFQGFCIGNLTMASSRYNIQQIDDIQDVSRERITAMGFDLSTREMRTLSVICVDGSPVLVATNGIRARDIVLSPGNGMMAWTWNFVFRQSIHDSRRYDLIGQAVPLKGNSRASLGRQRCCDSSDCPTRRSRTQVFLHHEDILTLAILGRAAVERLRNPVTTTKCASYAVFN